MPTLFEYYRQHAFVPTTFDILSPEKLARHRAKRENLYINKLSIPRLLWRDARVLEVGPASGENALICAQDGARLAFVEPLEPAVERLHALFRHYGQQNAIDTVHIDTIENVSLPEAAFDVVIAEGFLGTLRRRDEVIRSLFASLGPDGLLIVSVNDSVGSFVECMKGAIAQLACRVRSLTDLDDCVRAVEPFFAEDFHRIPHSRPFELWVKDALFNPLMDLDNFYDFDLVLEDLAPLDPHFYSSWPCYLSPNDLTWHKYAPSPQARHRDILAAYRLRRSSFLLGEVLDPEPSLAALLEQANDNPADWVRTVLLAHQAELRRNDSGTLLDALTRIAPHRKGRVRQLLDECLLNLQRPDPATYLDSPLLRSHWGVPYHYLVFRK